MVTDTRDQTARDRAVTQLKKRRDFHGHLLVYLLVNTFIVVIWVITGPRGFFWPVFPIVGWGIGVVMNAWDVYWRPRITEQDIRREMSASTSRSERGGTSLGPPAPAGAPPPAVSRAWMTAPDPGSASAQQSPPGGVL